MWLSDLLHSGFSLKHAIDFSVEMWAKNPQLKQIQQSLAAGKNFSSAVRPMVGDSLYLQLALAEEHGCLEEALTKIGQLMKMKHQQIRKLNSLLQYPCLLLVMLLAVILMMKLFVFPELSQWTNGDQQIQNILMNVQLIGWTCLGVLVVMIGVFSVKYWRSSLIGRTQMLCQIPVIGSCFQEYYRYYLTVNLTMLLENGLSIKQICQLLKRQTGTSLLKELASYFEKQLSQGQDVSDHLTRFSFIPPELSMIIQSGSAQGKEIQDLLALTKVLFHRLTTVITNRLAMVQPILFGTLALIIVGLYLLLLLPIYSSIQGVM